MSNFILLIVCLLMGMLLRRLPGFPPRAYEGLNAFIIYISLPAISLRYVPEMQLSTQSLFPFLMSWLVLGAAAGFFYLLKPLLKYRRDTMGCLILTCGLGNISFVGFPVVEALYGTEGLKVAVLVDQGAFLALSTVGVALAMIFSSGRVKARVLMRRVLSFPPFIAFVIALLLSALGPLPETIQVVLERLGATLSPLALVSIGLQLSFKFRQISATHYLIGLLYKLGVAPLLIYGLYQGLLSVEELRAKVSVIEAAMAPMITASILATQYKLNPPLANLLVGIGIPVSLLTILLWWRLLELI
ncbi:MAG: AEC family transporter [Bacteroidia bacterium]|nr:AEC family transporter [Bacteroidia bacterium]